MSRLLCLLFLSSLGIAATVQDPKKFGSELAEAIRTSSPDEPSTWSGVLRIEKPGGREEIPIRCDMFPPDPSGTWKVRYHTGATETRGAEELTVLHKEGDRNTYLYSKAPGPKEKPSETQALKGAAANIPLAGSDFFLSDLGLEFLHWPEQIWLRRQLRRGQTCHVLESRNPTAGANEYSRVVSWIDEDTNVIILAEAFDAKGTRIKQFLPKSYLTKKGIPKSIRMSSRSGSETLLEFDRAEK